MKSKMKKRKVNKETAVYKRKIAKRELKLLDKLWSNNIKYRDESKCCICGDTKLVHTHHIIPRERKATRHVFDNGVTICPLHHKYSFEISAHRNSFAFFLWFMRNRSEQFNKLVLLNDNIPNGQQV